MGAHSFRYYFSISNPPCARVSPKGREVKTQENKKRHRFLSFIFFVDVDEDGRINLQYLDYDLNHGPWSMAAIAIRELPRVISAL
jgi:hypothetical protein